MHCIVTGAAGFIGSTLSERLIREGHTVKGIDCFTSYYGREAKERNLAVLRDSKNFEFVEEDLVNTNISALIDGADWLFHQAGQPGVRASWGREFDQYTHSNIAATQRLLEGLKENLQNGSSVTKNVKSLVYASSSSVYGNAESYPTKETFVPHPVSPYGVTKLAAEHLMCLFASEFSVPTVSLRYFTVFGPRQRPDLAFHRFIRAALQKEEIPLYGDGEQTRDFTFVDDIVSANILAAKKGKPGQVFNIGGGNYASVNQVLSILETALGHLRVRRMDKMPGDMKHTKADTSRAQEALGFAPTVNLETGLKRQIEWLEKEIAR